MKRNPDSAPRTRAIAALRAGQAVVRPSVELDGAGYAASYLDNLLPGINPADFEADLRQGSGSELEDKFRAAHSSSALAVNCFAPFKRHLQDLALCGQRGFIDLQFEKKCPTGLRRGTPPNLDLVAESPSTVIGVESKCLEYLSPHAARFAPAYYEQITDERRDGGWFREMSRLIEAPRRYTRLDAAQLVKHAFGLANVYRDRPVLLLYLFWEPPNADDFPVFRQHRQEISELGDRIAGSSPSFTAMSYHELWRDLEAADPPDWLAHHLSQLRERYWRPI